MKRLKELRVASNFTQETLADALGVSQQTIARWEAGKAEPSLKGLRDIAVLFGTSVDDLLEMARSKAKITTNHYSVSATSLQDGFWGHLGLMLPDQAKSIWFPITGDESTRVMSNLQGTDSGWVVVSTLNNRRLVFDPSKFKKISLVDDDEDQIENDWDLTWDGYQGHSPEIYKALEMRINEAYTDEEFDEEYSESIRNEVGALIAEHKFDSEKIDSELLNLHIYHADGMTSSFAAEPEKLAEVSFMGESEFDEILVLTELGRGRYFFFPSSDVIMIDMPLIKVIEGEKEIFDEE